MQHMTIEPSAMTFEDVCRAARVAEKMGQQPLTLDEQATLYAIKVHAYHSLSTLVHKALAMLDELAGDADMEGDPFNEGEPAFDLASRAMVDVHGGTIINGDEGDYSVAGWHAGRYGAQNDDAEDDDPAEAVGDEQDGTRAEDESGFVVIGHGAGCIIADPDKSADDEGEDNDGWER